MSDARPWFKAKTYGWGWGPAVTWQGWVTYTIYAGLLVTSGMLFPPDRASLSTRFHTASAKSSRS